MSEKQPKLFVEFPRKLENIPSVSEVVQFLSLSDSKIILTDAQQSQLQQILDKRNFTAKQSPEWFTADQASGRAWASMILVILAWHRTVLASEHGDDQKQKTVRRFAYIQNMLLDNSATRLKRLVNFENFGGSWLPGMLTYQFFTYRKGFVVELFSFLGEPLPNNQLEYLRSLDVSKRAWLDEASLRCLSQKDKRIEMPDEAFSARSINRAAEALQYTKRFPSTLSVGGSAHRSTQAILAPTSMTAASFRHETYHAHHPGMMFGALGSVLDEGMTQWLTEKEDRRKFPRWKQLLLGIVDDITAEFGTIMPSFQLSAYGEEVRLVDWLMSQEEEGYERFSQAYKNGSVEDIKNFFAYLLRTVGEEGILALIMAQHEWNAKEPYIPLSQAVQIIEASAQKQR